MKTGNKKVAKCLTTLGMTAAMTLQGICPADGFATVLAAGTESVKTGGKTGIDTASNSRIEALLTDYRPQVIEYTDPYSGFTH